MKKASFFFVLIVFQTLAFGQDYKTAVGIKLNPGIATYFFSADHSRFALSGGFEVNQKIINDHFFIEMGLQVLDRGGKITANFEDEYGNFLGEKTQRIHTYYLSSPFSIGYAYQRFYISSGLNFNFELGVVKNLEGATIIDSFLLISHPIINESLIQFGWQIAFGYKFPVSDYLFITIDSYLNKDYKNKSFWGDINYYGDNYGIGIGLKYILH
ncbi:MAG: outer membrane beta-barrel protein [Bacteroidetes bacterium]|nr:outer membrane beta-barrel protein [Bacteroidota bacterium]MBT5528413.1 outer membrane beta-barrel protein [Cytophagia bacterium]MBT3800774.1 outer membrane beta-barrel protein [Bacteroidota bacterium]MBT3935278.1 outer membrane beta-barrel protein [Bacteroidota bacterium]MBT4339332.1 outer membrane beta-barrel protein [Bacteroidota bacterium]